MSDIESIGAKDRVSAHSRAGSGILTGVEVEGYWDFTAHRPIYKTDGSGEVERWMRLWRDGYENLVVTQGRDHMLDSTFGAGTQFTVWFIALTKTLGGSPVAGDVYSGFMGTANEEVIAYDEAARVTFVEGTPSAGSVDNVGNEAVFTIDTNSTVIGGGALVSFATKNNTAEGGAIMYSAGAFTAGDKSLDDNDTLTVTLTLTVTAS